MMKQNVFKINFNMVIIVLVLLPMLAFLNCNNVKHLCGVAQHVQM